MALPKSATLREKLTVLQYMRTLYSYRKACEAGYTEEQAKSYAMTVLDGLGMRGRHAMFRDPGPKRGGGLIGVGGKYGGITNYDRLMGQEPTVKVNPKQKCLLDHIQNITGFRPSDVWVGLMGYWDIYTVYADWYQCHRGRDLYLFYFGPFDVMAATAKVFNLSNGATEFPTPTMVAAEGYGLPGRFVEAVQQGLPPYVLQFLAAHREKWAAEGEGLFDELEHITQEQLARCRTFEDFRGWAQRRIEKEDMRKLRFASAPFPFQGSVKFGGNVLRLVKDPAELVTAAKMLKNCAGGEHYIRQLRAKDKLVMVEWNGSKAVSMAEYLLVHSYDRRERWTQLVVSCNKPMGEDYRAKFQRAGRVLVNAVKGQQQEVKAAKRKTKRGVA